MLYIYIYIYIYMCVCMCVCIYYVYSFSRYEGVCSMQHVVLACMKAVYRSNEGVYTHICF